MPIVNIKPHPFKQQRHQVYVPGPVTLHQLLPKERGHVRAFVNGIEFDELKPLHENDIVDIVLTPKGDDRQETTQKAVAAGVTILASALSGGIGAPAAVGFWAGAAKGALAGGAIAGLQLIGASITLNPGNGYHRKGNKFNRLGALECQQ